MPTVFTLLGYIEENEEVIAQHWNTFFNNNR